MGKPVRKVQVVKYDLLDAEEVQVVSSPDSADEILFRTAFPNDWTPKVTIVQHSEWAKKVYFTDREPD